MSKDNPQNGRKCLHITFMCTFVYKFVTNVTVSQNVKVTTRPKGLGLKACTKNTYNSTIKWQDFLNGLRVWIDLSPGKIYNKHVKRCSTSLATQEVQFRTRVSLHFTPTKMATIKNKDNKCDKGVVKNGTLILWWWECKMVQIFLENSLTIPQNITHKVTIWPSNSTRCIPTRIENMFTQKLYIFRTVYLTEVKV